MDSNFVDGNNVCPLLCCFHWKFSCAPTTCNANNDTKITKILTRSKMTQKQWVWRSQRFWLEIRRCIVLNPHKKKWNATKQQRHKLGTLWKLTTPNQTTKTPKSLRYMLPNKVVVVIVSMNYIQWWPQQSSKFSCSAVYMSVCVVMIIDFSLSL